MGISALIMGAVGAVGSVTAANKQAKTAQNVADQQLAAGREAAHRLDPFVQEGKMGMGLLNQKINYLTRAFNPTQAQLEATPGYKFALDQGLKATQNSAAARGLGISGAALKGAADYATGLANNTYATQAQIYAGNQERIGNLLTGIVGMGGNAAAGQGNLITGQSNAAGQTQMSGATAAASGIMGATNALTGAIGNYAQAPYLQAMMQQNGGAGFNGFKY